MTENTEVKISSKAKKILRSQSHEIEPVVWVGKEGIEKTIEEIKRQIKDKSLIKIKVRKSALENGDKSEMAEKITKETGAEVISVVGNVITIFKPKEGWKKYSTKKTKKEKYVEEFEEMRSKKALLKR
ncbi:RNA-binding protein [Methanococcus maripaludis]|uniref:RNA-binding protein n=1 Tax=Methanococcus maripaludis TaxID=39152 RepID=A0A7J9NI51_METMI|nr:ribosome assembly RNA-binding protein YhbY [Methanococcus maripaludis]MBA2840558.1 RNA-binding protein [Methanococcus maripaludis]MBA2853326.1 RNA-binding protein [Methanococcus maripaludis]MBA2860257.1 RNA-binding protein [Methanococcus maripaludis]MBA2869279.1 RNA-binding protein [Methanococcus maripaludis]MBB6401970.1 RNA-binding protein [Methanococcus maripaludis]